MLDKPISPLRQRMIDDTTARRFNEHTQRDYVRNVRMFAAFLGRSPDTATKEDLRRFQRLWCKRFEVEPSRRREVALDHAARTAFQILGAVLPLAPSLPSLN
jgi:hypothetical protein